MNAAVPVFVILALAHQFHFPPVKVVMVCGFRTGAGLTQISRENHHL